MVEFLASDKAYQPPVLLFAPIPFSSLSFLFAFNPAIVTFGESNVQNKLLRKCY